MSAGQGDLFGDGYQMTATNRRDTPATPQRREATPPRPRPDWRIERDQDGLPARLVLHTAPATPYAAHWAETYPASPGFAEGSLTSLEAAETVDADTLRALVLDALCRHGPMTPDECAAALGRSVLSVRPRCTELKALGLLTETGETRANASGKRAAVLRLLAPTSERV